MMKKPLKLLFYLLALILSPMILAGLAGAVFLAAHLANGESWAEAIQALHLLINQVLPFLPYITGIPAVLVIAAIIFRRKRLLES